MENNNTQTPQAPQVAQPVTPPVAPTAPAPNRVKSYTERFQEMEIQLVQLTELYSEANQAFGVTASIVKDLATQNRMLNDQLQAVYDLAEEGKAISRDAVTQKVNDRRVKKVQDMLDRDEKAGVLKKIDSITKDDDIIVYESEEISLAFKALAAFEQDGIKNELTGKKVGDTVGKITIKGLYEIVELQNTEGQSDDKTQQ